MIPSWAASTNRFPSKKNNDCRECATKIPCGSCGNSTGRDVGADGTGAEAAGATSADHATIEDAAEALAGPKTGRFRAHLATGAHLAQTARHPVKARLAAKGRFPDQFRLINRSQLE